MRTAAATRASSRTDSSSNRRPVCKQSRSSNSKAFQQAVNIKAGWEMQQPQGQAAEQTLAATARPVCKQSTARQGGNKGLSMLHHHPVAGG